MPEAPQRAWPRRTVLGLLAGGGLAAASPLLRAQTAWPTRPVRLVVPSAAASGSDLLARGLAQKLAELWGQPVTVDNRAGGSGIIGVEAVVRASPDGYTLLLSSASPITINPLVFRKLPHDPQRDLMPVSHVGIAPAALLVNSATPARNLAELVALAKAKPRELSHGSFGTGSGGHLALEAFCQAADIQMLHVPYKGTGPAVNDLLAGQITCVLTDLAGAQGFIQSGKLRALAINGPTRSPILPDVATFTEQGFASVEATYGRFGLFAPAGTPREVVQSISVSVVRALQSSELRDRFTPMGYLLEGSTPAAFTTIIAQDAERWGRVVTALGGISLD